MRDGHVLLHNLSPVESDLQPALVLLLHEQLHRQLQAQGEAQVWQQTQNLMH